MKKQLNEIINSNWFFVALVFFVAVLPFSQALVSIAGGILLFVALLESLVKNKFEPFNRNKILLSVSAIFLIYLLSAIVSGPFKNSVYDLQKNIFFLIIPVSFILGNKISTIQKRYIFYVFTTSVIVSTIVAIIKWKISDSQVLFSVHSASLISHIRFSFQLILGFWFYILVLQTNFKKLKTTHKALLILTALYFVAFILFQQSLTGLLALTGSSVIFIFYLISRIKIRYKYFLLILAVLIIISPAIYISKIVSRFYNIEVVDQAKIDLTTKQGNNYQHDFKDLSVENGRYVNLYVSETELREEWNKRSTINYDSKGKNGFAVKATLKRYLTSKGLRKDAEGVIALTEKDIQNIENGIANVVYAEKKYSLYPRIYQTIWEYYNYSVTGNANRQSFSQRIEYAKAAMSIIGKNLWFGVGTGNWKDEFQNYYKSNSSNLKEEFYASSHNQYLNYMVKFGIIGFTVILFLLVYPVIKTGAYHDILFVLFLVFMFFANFADSNFESHMGSSFFVFFYCLFLVSDRNYLRLNSK